MLMIEEKKKKPKPEINNTYLVPDFQDFDINHMMEHETKENDFDQTAIGSNQKI